MKQYVGRHSITVLSQKSHALAAFMPGTQQCDLAPIVPPPPPSPDTAVRRLSSIHVSLSAWPPTRFPTAWLAHDGVIP